jgi:flagellar hook-basal body complex protein FliE
MAPIAPIPPSLSAPVTAGILQTLHGELPAAIAAQAGQGAPLATFQEFFADAVHQTSALQSQAETAQKRLLVGESDDLHGVMIAMEKAGMAFQLTLAVRNKVVEAYQEVMRMQI